VFLLRESTLLGNFYLFLPLNLIIQKENKNIVNTTNNRNDQTIIPSTTKEKRTDPKEESIWDLDKKIPLKYMIIGEKWKKKKKNFIESMGYI
jgi:hypothetical protein